MPRPLTTHADPYHPRPDITGPTPHRVEPAIHIEGAWYCQTIPENLIDASIHHFIDETIDEETWRTRLTERDRYRFQRKYTKPNGDVVYWCPASGPTLTASCNLKDQVNKNNADQKRAEEIAAGRESMLLKHFRPNRLLAGPAVGH